MTEQDWLCCKEIFQLNDLLDTASSRKKRLFACACVREIGHWITEETCRQTLELVEDYIDGRTTRSKVIAIAAAAERAAWPEFYERPNVSSLAPCTADLVASMLGRICEDDEATWNLTHATGMVMQVVMEKVKTDKTVKRSRVATFHLQEKKTSEMVARQCDILRDIIINPFRPVVFDPAWRRVSNVTGVAQTVYNDRWFAGLPILADALEESGCTSTELINHCRQSGSHVHGCWALDLVLDKK